MGAWLGGLAVCLLMMMLARTRTKAATILHFLVKHQQEGRLVAVVGVCRATTAASETGAKPKAKAEMLGTRTRELV